MSKPISVGDLVVTVRTCCDKYMEGVYTFQVLYMRPRLHPVPCTYCRTSLSGVFASDSEKNTGAPVGWLKRIEPLGELDDVKQDEEVYG